jgi:hypothetical protein
MYDASAGPAQRSSTCPKKFSRTGAMLVVHHHETGPVLAPMRIGSGAVRQSGFEGIGECHRLLSQLTYYPR